MRYAYFALLLSALTTVSTASDWLTLPSTYSHHPVGGQRISQYAPIKNPTGLSVPNFRSSGYTHSRSQLNFRGSFDNYHRVEEWGEPVRPYGEWQRPYRPYSVPYDLWGPPFGGLNLGFGFNGFPNQGFRGQGFGRNGVGGQGFGGQGFRRPGYGQPHGFGYDERFRGKAFRDPYESGYGPRGHGKPGGHGGRGGGHPGGPMPPKQTQPMQYH